MDNIQKSCVADLAFASPVTQETTKFDFSLASFGVIDSDNHAFASPATPTPRNFVTNGYDYTLIPSVWQGKILADVDNAFGMLKRADLALSRRVRNVDDDSLVGLSILLHMTLESRRTLYICANRNRKYHVTKFISQSGKYLQTQRLKPSFNENHGIQKIYKHSTRRGYSRSHARSADFVVTSLSSWKLERPGHGDRHLTSIREVDDNYDLVIVERPTKCNPKVLIELLATLMHSRVLYLGEMPQY